MGILYGFDSEFVSTFPGTVLEITFEHTSEVSNHPVEDGDTVSDHSASAPDQATAKIVLSPVVIHGTAQNIQDGYALILRIKNERVLCSITADVGTLDSALLIHVQVMRNVAEGTALTLELGFQHIKLVQTRTVAAPTIVARRRQHQGATTTDVPPAQREALLHRAVHDIPRLFSGG